MNGWNGVNGAVPFVSGLGGAANPSQNFNPGYLPSSYMTPAGGTEIMNPMAPINLQPLNAGLPSIGGAQGSTGWFGIDGLGKNLDTLKMGVGVLGSVANIWSGLQQNKLAKQSFNYQKGLADTNLANSIRSFNLQLDDKLRSRQVVEGSSDAQREAARAQWAARDERRG